MMPPRGPPRVLCVVVVTTWRAAPARVQTRGDQAGEVRHVDHQVRADLVGDAAERGEVELTRVGRPAGQDQLRAVFPGQALDLVHVDQVVFARTWYATTL